MPTEPTPQEQQPSTEIQQVLEGNKNQAIGEMSGGNAFGTVEGSISIINYYYRESIGSESVESTATAGDVNLPCPYRGLFHFSPNDAEFFFGREVFVEELFAATQTCNFIPVLGASGSGKSSVVLAGLVPKLEQEGHWLFIHFRPGSDPFHALASSLVPLYTQNLDYTDNIILARKLSKALGEGEIPLADVFAQIHQNHPTDRVLLIADQFEEIYTLCTDEKIRRSFLDTLLASFTSFSSQSQYKRVLVATMRADFLGNALLYPLFGDVLKTNIKLIRSMSCEELEQVIVKPSEKLGVTFQEGLVKRILDDAYSEPGNLPLLEFALTELWKRRKGKLLTHAAYEEIGELKGVLSRHTDENYSKLSASEKGQEKSATDEWLRISLDERNLELTAQQLVYEACIAISPEAIIIGDEIEISVNLKQAEITENEAYTLQIPHKEAIANELNIIINAPGFQLNGDNTASLPLDPNTAKETQTARFRLTALRPGSATITAELYRGDTFETKLETQIQVADIDEATFTPQRITTQPRPVPQPDFILRIQRISNETNSKSKFQYQLKSFRFPSVFSDNNIYTSDLFPSRWIEQVWGLLATTLENISSSLPQEGKWRLISLGQYLFENLFPTELQSDFRSLIPQNSTFTLLILADQEAWIPWELLYDGQRFLGDRFIISHWFQELNDTRPYEFPVGAVNIAHYANVEHPQLWATLLEAKGAPPPQPLSAGVLHDSTEAIRGLHLIRYSQSSDAANLRNAPVTLDNINDTEDIELQMRPAKLNLRRNRPFVTLSYVKTDTPELTALENTWASAFIRAGCSGFTGSLWAVESSVEAAFISCFYNRLWAGASLGEAFYTSRQLARAAVPDSLDWLAYVLFGDPMARPYRPVPGDGYAIVEPIGREIDDPLPPGASARFRVTLRRNPPVWHEDRVIEVAENLVFENLQVHIVTYGLQVIPDSPVTMTLTAKGDYLGWLTLVVPSEITGTSALVQVYFADGMRSIHSLYFSLEIENGREE